MPPEANELTEPTKNLSMTPHMCRLLKTRGIKAVSPVFRLSRVSLPPGSFARFQEIIDFLKSLARRGPSTAKPPPSPAELRAALPASAIFVVPRFVSLSSLWSASPCRYYIIESLLLIIAKTPIIWENLCAGFKDLAAGRLNRSAKIDPF